MWCGVVSEFGLVWLSMVWYGLVWFGMVKYGLVWFGMVKYGLASKLSMVWQAS